jgi:hypothetical protein
VASMSLASGAPKARAAAAAGTVADQLINALASPDELEELFSSEPWKPADHLVDL